MIEGQPYLHLLQPGASSINLALGVGHSLLELTRRRGRSGNCAAHCVLSFFLLGGDTACLALSLGPLSGHFCQETALLGHKIGMQLPFLFLRLTPKKTQPVPKRAYVIHGADKAHFMALRNVAFNRYNMRPTRTSS